MTTEDLNEVKKTYPKGWHAKKEFIDENGNKWEKGKFVGNVKDNPVIETPVIETPAVKPPEVQETPKETSDNAEIDQMRNELKELKLIMQGLKNNPPTQPVFTNATIQKEQIAFGTYNANNIPVNDYLPKQKRYIKLGKGYSLSSYIKDGKVILAPFNMPIYFRREFDELSGENNRVIPFCEYKTHSKLESEFIENSPYWNITIHATKEEAENVDMTSVDKMESVILSVQRMDNNSILAKAASLNMDIHQDEAKLRAAITKVMISQEMNRDLQLQNDRILRREMENERFKNASDKDE